jgi:DNA repair exonuclease SbcCD ATPase subunit
VVWRHEHPIIPDFTKTHIYGTVLESEAEEGSILSKYEIYDHTDDHKKVREVIRRRYKLGEPIKISMRFREYSRGGSPIHYDVIEHSLTPTPACPECKMIEFINESDIMPDKTDEQIKAELEKIKALEADLTKKEKLLEDLEVKIVTLEKSITEKDEVLSEKDKVLDEKETERKEILDKLLEINDKFNEQEKVVNELKEARKMDKLMPLVERAVKKDGEIMRSLYIKEAKTNEKAEEFLLERLKELEKDKPMAEVTDLRESAEDSIIDEELEEEPIKNKRDAKAFKNMPPEFKKWFKGD